MYNLVKSVTTIVVLLLFCCCSKNDLRLMDDPAVMAIFQQHIDDIVKEGYQVDEVTISTKEFGRHGPDYVGDVELMYIRALPLQSGIEHMANFSCSHGLISLNFLGYPISTANERKEKPYTGNPNLSDALLRLDDLKAQIPADYIYKSLLHLQYCTTDDGQGVYKLEVEVKPAKKAVSHPKVRQQEKKYNQFKVSRSTRNSTGGLRDVHQNKLIKKDQYTMTFRLTNEIIELL